MSGEGAPAAGQPALKVFLVACEESGDRLGAALMQALVARSARPVEFIGVGGGAMAARGLRSLFPISDLAIVGINAVIAKLPMIFRRIKQTASAVLAAHPDVLIIIDSPDFTHRVARRVRAAAPDIPILDYVSPTVWVWRPGRARAMRKYVDHVLALLPFEPAVHERLGGPPCTYVGHPVVEQAAGLRPTRDEQARRDSTPPVVLILPGSRTGEIDRLLGMFGETVRALVEKRGRLELVLPTVPHLFERIKQVTSRWPNPPRVIVDDNEKMAAFRTAHAALAASGTVTLELAIACVPTVVAYRVSAIEGVIGRLLLHGSTIVLANLILGENVMPEYVQGAVTPQRLADALAPLIGSSAARSRQLSAFAKLDAIMGIGQVQVSPSVRAADIVVGAASSKRTA